MQTPTRLSNWPWVEVRVDCRICPRRGCYRLARLAEAFGAEMDLERLIAVLARDCPYWRNNPRPYEPRCGARFTDWDRQAPPKLERSVDHTSRFSPMGSSAPRTLLHLPGPTIEIVCEPCKRRGRYKITTLLDRFGPEMPLPTLLLKVAGCMGSRETLPRCSAIYVDLPEW